MSSLVPVLLQVIKVCGCQLIPWLYCHMLFMEECLGTRLPHTHTYLQTLWRNAWVQGYHIHVHIYKHCGGMPGYKATTYTYISTNTVEECLGTRLPHTRTYLQTLWRNAWVQGYHIHVHIYKHCGGMPGYKLTCNKCCGGRYKASYPQLTKAWVQCKG